MHHRFSGSSSAIVFTALVLSLMAPGADAGLAWELDPATQTASLSGTTATLANPHFFGSGSAVVWSALVTIPGAATSFVGTTAIATYDLPSPIVISNNPNNAAAGYFLGPSPSDPAQIWLSLSINGNVPPPATITGIGVGVSYSGWDPLVIAYFESFTASSPMVLNGQSGINETMLVYAVPEPASLTLLAFSGVAVLRRRRRA